MSKCREAFISYYNFTPEQYDPEWNEWKAAWTAATLNAVEICIKQRADTHDEDAVGWNTACTECAEAIEKEKAE